MIFSPKIRSIVFVDKGMRSIASDNHVTFEFTEAVQTTKTKGPRGGTKSEKVQLSSVAMF